MIEKTTDKISLQLENRKRNLAVIQEAIDIDKNSGYKLIPVKDFLSQRIDSLEHELKRN
jgi:hypothetical protein